jgi:hypothetical protein
MSGMFRRVLITINRKTVTVSTRSNLQEIDFRKVVLNGHLVAISHNLFNLTTLLGITTLSCYLQADLSYFCRFEFISKCWQTACFA